MQQLKFTNVFQEVKKLLESNKKSNQYFVLVCTIFSA